MWKIAVDAMGGDNAPKAIIEGALLALKRHDNIHISLIGQKDVIDQYLPEGVERVDVVHMPEVIETCEPPLVAIRKKKNSSLVEGLYMVKDGRADAFITAGSTGATLSGALFYTGRIKGIQRPALAPMLPTKDGNALLIDCGANAEVKEEYLVQFAHMGSAYMELVMGVQNPKVALVNIGAEDEKGSELYRNTHKRLREEETINFVGNLEARYANSGEADVLVCDGFTGNILLKTMEGTAMFLLKVIKEELTKNVFRKIGALILKGAFKEVKKKLNHDEVGGAPLLGIDGCVIKAHGSSNPYSFSMAVGQAVAYLDGDVTQAIKSKIEKE